MNNLLALGQWQSKSRQRALGQDQHWLSDLVQFSSLGISYRQYGLGRTGVGSEADIYLRFEVLPTASEYTGLAQHNEHWRSADYESVCACPKDVTASVDNAVG